MGYLDIPPSGGGSGSGWNVSGTVSNYSSLPAANLHTDELWLVINNQGVWPFTFVPKGYYTSDGSTWSAVEFDAQAIAELENRIIATTAPLAGGGNLSADRTLSISKADATTDGYLSAADFVIFSAGSAGDVVGPASSIDNTVARFDGTTGKLLQDSRLTILDSGFSTLEATNGITTGNILTVDIVSTIPSLTLNPAGSFLTSSNISQGFVNGSLILSGAPAATGAQIILNSAAGGSQFTTQFLNNGTAGNIDLAGQWSFGYASPSNRIHGFYKDVLAGDSNTAVTVEIGNSQGSQGKANISFRNDVPTGSPTFDINFAPRDNTNTGLLQAAQIRMQKTSGNQGTNMYFTTSDTSGNPKLALSLTPEQVTELAPGAELRFTDLVGGQYVGFKSPGTVTGTTTYVLPEAPPSVNSVLQSDNASTLTWVDTSSLISFPILGPDGSDATPTYNFVSDTAQDTGMWHPGDGQLAFTANGVRVLDLTPNLATVTGDLTATGNLSAANFPPTGNANTFALYDSSNQLISDLGYAYDPNNFYGARWFQTVISDNSNNFSILHQFAATYNPTITDADETWNQLYLTTDIGNDDSGNQIGDYTDVKATLVVQDITYTSRRYGNDGNSTTIQYTPGATAGSEVVTSPSSFVYEIQIEDGVSTATQIVAAIDNAPGNPGDIRGSLDYAITGIGSNAQTIEGPTNLAGGANANGSLNMINLNINNNHKSNMGNANGFNVNYNMGNSTDLVKGNKFQAYGGNMFIHDNAMVQAASAFEYGFSTGDISNSSVNGDLRGVNIYGNPRVITQGVIGYQLGLNITSARYVESFITTMNSAGNITQGVNQFADFSSFSGDIGDNYYGVAIQPNLNTTDGFFGLNISPNVTASRFQSVGVNVNMGNIGLAAGLKASVTVQDLFIEAILSGTGLNGLQIEYVGDGVAGSETVSIAGNTLTVHMEDLVSTATQIQTALLANFQVLSNFNVTVSGVGSNPQTIQSPLTITGGTDGGSKSAAQFNQGDVSINGGKFTSGYELNSSAGQLPFVYSINSLGGSFKVQSGSPVNGGQFGILNQLAVGMDIEDDVLPDGTGFGLGTSMNGFLTQVGISAGKTMDSLNFMAAGASIPTGSGSLTNLAFFRVIGLIPQGGSLAVTNAYGFKVEPLLTATSPTNAWGFWSGDPNAHNWFSKNVIIGGSTGLPTGSYVLDVDGDVVINGIIHDTLNNQSIDTSARHLIKSGVNVLNWSNQTLVEASGTFDSLNWNDRIASDAAGVYCLDWANRQLIDSTSIVSIDWENRELKDTVNNATVDFKTTVKLSTGVQYKNSTKNADYTVDTGGSLDHVLFIDTSGNIVTITLPTATSGRELILKDSTGSFAANNLSIDAGAASIDGVTGISVLSSNWQSITLISDGTNWFVID